MDRASSTDTTWNRVCIGRFAQQGVNRKRVVDGMHGRSGIENRRKATTLLPRNLDRWIYRPVNVRLKDLQLRFDVIRGFERDRFHGSTTFVMGSCLSNFLHDSTAGVLYVCVFRRTCRWGL